MTASSHPFSDRLTTARLVLRRLRRGDAAAFAAYRSDPATARWQSWEAPYPLEHAEAFIVGATGDVPGLPGTSFTYALEPAGGGRIVGDVMLATRGDGRLVDLGVTLAPEHRGLGFATEAIGRVLDHVLVDPGGVHRVQANSDARNAASLALWHRLGFREEAVRLAAVWIDGEWIDDVEFALLAEDHLADRGA